MKICVYGAGAIGGWLGAALARSGFPLNVVARGATLQALRRDGLKVVRSSVARDESSCVSVHAVADPAVLGHQDLVVLAVKAPALPDVAARIAPLLGPRTTVLSAMNGVPWWFLEGGFGGPLAGRRLTSIDPSGLIAAGIPSRHVVGCVVHASCSVDSPGTVRHHFGDGLIIGEPSGEETARVRWVTDLLNAGGLQASVSRRIQADVWYKLWGNMTVNPVSALTGATGDKILGDELLRGFMSSVMREAQAIGERIGQDHPQLKFGLGYDHNYIVQDQRSEKPKSVALVQEPTTGRTMEVLTTEPGVQFYCGNFLDGSITGKSGKPYSHRMGLCLEAQIFPDSPNRQNKGPGYTNAVLRPGEKYRQVTVYRFGTEKQ